MSLENSKKHSSYKTLLAIIAAISAAAAIFCFVSPSLRKSGSLAATGNNALASMESAAAAISYYSADDIAVLSERPQLNAQCKYIAGLLAQLGSQQGYEKVYLLYRTPQKELQYLVDGSYRDNGQAGTDYYAPAAVYSTSGSYKAVKSAIDKIYSGKSTGGYASELITRQDFKQVAVSCLPIYGNSHSVVAILCIESDPGNTAYHMVGNINLYHVGLILLAVFALCLLLLIMRKKYKVFCEKRKTEREQKKAGTTIDQSAATAAESTADNVSGNADESDAVLTEQPNSDVPEDSSGDDDGRIDIHQ